jgi:methyltransferase (TIGR00027 family)
MKQGRASQTAALVAYFRALAHMGITSVEGFSDPTARSLLPPFWLWLLGKAEKQSLKRAPRNGGSLRTRIVDGMALRTLIIDLHVKAALSRGIQQVVILGAGLDGRGYRLTELSKARLFEVDHPATQAFKKSRTPQLSATAREITFVPVDFETDSLDAALEKRGHRKDQPTAWIWEGVVMYLTDQALRTTLRTISDRSAAGSALILNYHTPSPQKLFRKLAFTLRRSFFGLVAEPQIGEHSPQEIAQRVAEVGMRVTQDSGIKEWSQQFHASDPPLPHAYRMRVSVAEK